MRIYFNTFSLFLCCVFHWRHDALVELREERYTTQQMITTIAVLKHGRSNVKTQDSWNITHLKCFEMFDTAARQTMAFMFLYSSQKAWWSFVFIVLSRGGLPKKLVMTFTAAILDRKISPGPPSPSTITIHHHHPTITIHHHHPSPSTITCPTIPSPDRSSSNCRHCAASFIWRI